MGLECMACEIAVKVALEVSGVGDAAAAAKAILAGLKHAGISVPEEKIVQAIIDFGNDPEKICKAIGAC